MSHEVLTKDEDLLAYSEKAHLLIDVKLPLEYLKRSKVVVYRAKDGRILAGYCIAMAPPFRSLMPVPDDFKREVSTSLQSVIEINGVWVEPRHRRGILALNLCFSLTKDLFRSGKSNYLYSYSAHKTRLSQFYAKAKPRRIWCGDVYIDGMDRPDREVVEVVHRTNLLPFVLKNIFAKGIHAISRRGRKSVRQVDHSRIASRLIGQKYS